MYFTMPDSSNTETPGQMDPIEGTGGLLVYPEKLDQTQLQAEFLFFFKGFL